MHIAQTVLMSMCGIWQNGHIRVADMKLVKLSKFRTIMQHDCNAKSHVIVLLLPLSIGKLHVASKKQQVGLSHKEESPQDPVKLQGR